MLLPSSGLVTAAAAATGGCRPRPRPVADTTAVATGGLLPAGRSGAAAVAAVAAPAERGKVVTATGRGVAAAGCAGQPPLSPPSAIADPPAVGGVPRNRRRLRGADEDDGLQPALPPLTTRRRRRGRGGDKGRGESPALPPRPVERGVRPQPVRDVWLPLAMAVPLPLALPLSRSDGGAQVAVEPLLLGPDDHTRSGSLLLVEEPPVASAALPLALRRPLPRRAPPSLPPLPGVLSLVLVSPTPYPRPRPLRSPATPVGSVPPAELDVDSSLADDALGGDGSRR